MLQTNQIVSKYISQLPDRWLGIPSLNGSNIGVCLQVSASLSEIVYGVMFGRVKSPSVIVSLF